MLLREGYGGSFKLLLESKSDINSKDSEGRTPLSWAAERGHMSVVKLLLQDEKPISSAQR